MMKNKNQFYVVIIYSSHNNWDNAVANRDTQKQSGRDARIYYRGHEVTTDVKKIVKKPEGI